MTELKRLQSEEISQQTVTPVMPVEMTKNKKSNPIIKILVFVAVIALGVASGIGANAYLPGKSTLAEGSMRNKDVNPSSMKVGDIFGVKDGSEEFTDTAEGVVEKGGMGGEGSHKLVRPGGDDQTAYLTSSVVDMDEFVGHKVKIWGKTFAAQKAGWLLDVGKVQILELNAQPPSQE
jgi:hypothetical protein